MLSPERLEKYRQMTGGERLKLSLEMIEENIPFLYYGTPEMVDRRFALIHRENDLRNQNMLQAIARTCKVQPEARAG